MSKWDEYTYVQGESRNVTQHEITHKIFVVRKKIFQIEVAWLPDGHIVL